MAVTGVIMHGSKNVGNFTRVMNLNGNELSAYHEILEIKPEHQGQGIADRFNAHAISEYQHFGVDHISLEAGLTVGGYAWARQGFRFNPVHSMTRQQFVNDVLKAAQSRAEHVPNLRPHKAQLLKDIEALRKANNAGEDVQPIHLASLGEKYARTTGMDDHHREYVTWPGKSALLGRSWMGIYYFDAAKPVTAAASSLEHGALRPAYGLSAALTEALACHTAACRPPGSGGSGGSSSAASMMKAVQSSLDDDLRRAPWKGSDNPMAGHCYVASEALYHMLGGKASGWTPQFIRHEDAPHWFLRNGSKVLDPTASQFKTPLPYDQGKGKGFLTAEPSKRAATVMHRAEHSLAASAGEEFACHDASCRPPTSGGSGGSLRQHALPDVAPGDVRFAYRPRHPDGHPDPGEVVWAHVPFEDNPKVGKNRPVLIVGRTKDGNLVGVQLTSKTHHPGSIPIEWGDKNIASHIRPERFIQVDKSNYFKEGSYIKKPKFQDIVNTLTKRHGLTTQTFILEEATFACHDASCRPPTSGGTGGSRPGSAGFSGMSPTAEGRVVPKHLITYLDHDTLDAVGFGHGELDVGTRGSLFVKSFYDAKLPEGISMSMRVEQVPGGSSHVVGVIKNEFGRRVGNMERTIEWDDHGKTVVTHDSLVLDPEFQGRGIASAINSHAMQAYERYGVDHIVVHAGYSAGGYVWAAAGFRVRPLKMDGSTGKRESQIAQFAIRASSEVLPTLAANAHITTAQHSALQSEINRLARASADGQDIQPIHIASLGQKDMQFTKKGAQGDYKTWPGKEILLGTTWTGEYYLGKPLTASVDSMSLTETEDFYSPMQPRDKHGRWSSRGAGISVPNPRRFDPKCIPAPCVTESIERSGTMARQLLHRSIVRSILSGATPPPTLTILGGGGGAGKTTAVDKLGLKESHTATINADDIKEKIPEYEQLLRKGDRSAAAFVHEESSKIGKDAQAEARKLGVGVTLDQVGSDPKKVAAQIDAFVAAGYRDIQAVYVTTHTHVAVERARIRAEKKGREVPEAVLRAAHRDVSRGFEEIAANPKIGKITLVDNNGETPVIIASGGGGRPLVIHDPVRYADFLAKGDL